MSTLRDIAKRAGVAPITVSRVINNSGYVSEATRTRVEAAIVELDYIPNVVARNLRSQRTDTLGLILTDITNPFWTTVARGVEDAASDAGYNVIFCNTDEKESEQDEYLRLLLQRRVDGLLLVPVRNAAKAVRSSQNQKCPIVLLDRRTNEIPVDIVRCDSQGGAYQLIKHLCEAGHEQIAVLTGPDGISTAQDRVIGYRQALTEKGVQVNEELVFRGDFTQESGYLMTQQALAASPVPSALFAANNFIAIGALQALRDAGLSVPEDIAVVAFDDLPLGLVIDPFLTVAAQPAYEMGRQATELLLERLRTPDNQDYREIVLPTELIIRRSCGST